MRHFLQKKPRFIYHLAIASIWLLFLAGSNQWGEIPIRSIFPFLFPVLLIAWSYGMGWGFLFAAFGTLAAMPGGYMEQHEIHEVYWAAFTTYLKMTVAVAGIVSGKRLVEKRDRTRRY